MTVTNQKPATLSPVYQSSINGQFDPVRSLRETVAEPLYEPVVQGTAVSIQSNGVDISATDVADKVLACCGDNIDAAAEAWCKVVYGQTLLHFDRATPLRIHDLFVTQAAVSAKLPYPTPTMQYAPATDIIQPSREFLAGQCDVDKLFASYAFTFRPETLGFYFVNEPAFDAFKTWLATQITTVANVLPPVTNQLLSDFQTNIKLNNLTESLVIRNDDGDNNDEYSFARVLISYLMQYATQVSPSEFGVFPFNLGQLFCPRTVVFINVERHSRATAQQVKKEWDIINKSLQMNVNMVSQGTLNRLTATVRNLQKIAANAAAAVNSAGVGPSRAAAIPFRTKAPTAVDLTRMVKKLMQKLNRVNRSENSYKSVKMTFQKPNRRDPDDFNKQGKSVSTKYYPDIHVYIDTSGSISEENYEDAVRALIALAKRLNINLYFNSFSHYLSQCTKLSTKDKTLRQIYAAFQRVPKVTGGTDFANVWAYIMRSKKRVRELSIMITDFEYSPPNKNFQHPPNLYYAPCSRVSWNGSCGILENAKTFCDSMSHVEPNLRAKLLF